MHTKTKNQRIADLENRVKYLESVIERIGQAINPILIPTITTWPPPNGVGSHTWIGDPLPGLTTTTGIPNGVTSTAGTN